MVRRHIFPVCKHHSRCLLLWEHKWNYVYLFIFSHIRKLMSLIPECATMYVLYSCVCENLCLISLSVRKCMSSIPVCAKTCVLYSCVCENLCVLSLSVWKCMSYIPVCAKTYVLYPCMCENLCLIFLCVRKLMPYILVCAKTYVLYSYVCKNVCFISWWCVGKRLAAFSRNNAGIMFYDIPEVFLKWPSIVGKHFLRKTNSRKYSTVTMYLDF